MILNISINFYKECNHIWLFFFFRITGKWINLKKDTIEKESMLVGGHAGIVTEIDAVYKKKLKIIDKSIDIGNNLIIDKL